MFQFSFNKAAHNLTVDQYILNDFAKLNEIRNDNFYVTYLYSIEQAKLLSGIYFQQDINLIVNFYLNLLLNVVC